VGSQGRLDRVAIAVHDIDKAREFYSDLLGIKFDETIIDDQAGVSVAYSRAGFELISPHTGGGPFAQALFRFLEEHGEGVNVVTVVVDDLDIAVTHFADRGVFPIATVVAGEGKEVLFDPAELHGVPLVLNECPDPHPMTTAALVPGTQQAVGAVLSPI